MVHKDKIKYLNNFLINQNQFKNRPILYIMERDQRLQDNDALNYALELGTKYKQDVFIIFILNSQGNNNMEKYPIITNHLLGGLGKIKKDSKKYNIPFILNNNFNILNKIIKEINISSIVLDFSPLRSSICWKQNLVKQLSIPIIEVDTHNIFPAFYISTKQEFGAYTLRPKINKIFDKYLDIQEINNLSFENKALRERFYSYDEFEYFIKKQNREWVEPEIILEHFIQNKLSNYSERNNPISDVGSRLSPYLNFGHISSKIIVKEVLKYKNIYPLEVSSFIEEIIVRKELADNFCLYSKDYDNFNGFHKWAQKTLNDHRNDKRQYIYTLKELELGETHDEAWNSCVKEMALTNYMSGYMRMYWAKKILEWTSSPEEALYITNYLNDKYELDGRDPNGYVGSAWSIGGIHDRPWKEREIFGKIRYMNYEGLKRKFPIDVYIKNWKNK